MRIVKSPEERKTEILDAAEKLFAQKGYAQTTIMDVLNEVNIAKGTFYYYFKSKEDVMDSIISRLVETDAAAAKRIAENPDFSSISKICKILFSQKPQKGGAKEQALVHLNLPGNAEMHKKILTQSIVRLVPTLAQIVEQGIREKAMYTEYPYETVQILLVAGEMMFGGQLFHSEPEAAARNAVAFVNILECTLNVEKGAFDEIVDILLD